MATILDMSEFALPPRGRAASPGAPRKTNGSQPAKKQRREHFAYRIPQSFIKYCSYRSPNGLALVLGIMAETCSRIDAPADRWVAITTTFCERYGLTDRRRTSAIDKLEAAGIIRVERSSKRAPRVKLIPWPST